MADKKISELTALTGADTATDDQLVIVDTSAGLTKSITVAEFQNALDGSTGFVRITGDTMTGDLDMSGADVTLGYNDKLILGAGSDLQIYHDGANSYIQDVGTGALGLFGSTFVGLYETGSGDKMVIANGGSDVELYYDNALKLATTSTGVDITGTITSDGLTVDGALDVNHNVITQSANSPRIDLIEGDTTNVNTRFWQTGGDLRIYTLSDDTTTYSERIRLDHATGDISFYDSAGSSQSFYWSAADEALGIGTTSPATALDVLSGSASVGALKVKNASGASASTPILEAVNGGGNTRLIVLNDGSVGIGTSSPSYPMTIHSTGDGIKFEVSDTVDANYRIQVSGNDIITGPSTASDYTFQTGNTERMRISSDGSCRWTPDGSTQDMTLDASGNLLVGMTTDGITNTGIGLVSDGVSHMYSAGNGDNATLMLGRGGNDGNILSFNRSGSTVGSIATKSGEMYLGSANTGIRFYDAGDAITPFDVTGATGRDNAIDIGVSTARFKDLYLSNGIVGNSNSITISTDNGTTDHVTVDTSGNLLVGTTSLGNADAGVEARANGTLTTTADSQTALFVKRIGSGSNDDGELARFQNAEGTVGSIGSQGGSLVIGTDDTGFKTHQGVDAIVPYNPSSNAARDNAIDLGYSTNRFKDLYLSNGIVGDSNSITISTDNGTTDHVTVDTSGNFLVGKTSASSATAGFETKPTGFTAATRDGNTVLVLNRLTSDGVIANFRKDGTSVGSIGVSGNDFYVTGSATNIAGTYFANSKIMPMKSGATSDNTIDLGTSSKRFKDIYATNGTIQTSDEREKQDIAELSDAEQRVAVAAKGLLRKFRWRDAVEDKGDEARTHFGIIAQDLQAAFAAEGLDAGDYAMFISSTWTDEETGEERTRMGVRYSELLAFIIAAI